MKIIERESLPTHSMQAQPTVLPRDRYITICTACGDVHYKQVWYAPDSQFALFLDEDTDIVTHDICPACVMQQHGQYESILYVTGLPQKIEDEIMAVILYAAEQAHAENPQQRILEFAKNLNGYKITANSAELIRSICRQIQESGVGCDVHSVYQYIPRPLQICTVKRAVVQTCN